MLADFKGLTVFSAIPVVDCILLNALNNNGGTKQSCVSGHPWFELISMSGLNSLNPFLRVIKSVGHWLSEVLRSMELKLTRTFLPGVTWTLHTQSKLGE